MGRGQGRGHVETSHLQRIGGSSLTDDEVRVADAEANECSAVFIGAHSEDFSGYPDCRPAFFEAFQQVVDAGTKPETDIELLAPFVEWSKTDIAERGIELGVPYADTRSCYRSDEPVEEVFGDRAVISRP